MPRGPNRERRPADIVNCAVHMACTTGDARFLLLGRRTEYIYSPKQVLYII